MSLVLSFAPRPWLSVGLGASLIKALLFPYCRSVQSCVRLSSRSRSEDRRLRFAGLLISARKLLQVGARGQRVRRMFEGRMVRT